MAASLVIAISGLTHAARSATERGSVSHSQGTKTGVGSGPRSVTPCASCAIKSGMADVASSSVVGPSAAATSARVHARYMSGGGDAHAYGFRDGSFSKRVTRPACPDLRRGLAYYQDRARYWAHKMGAGPKGKAPRDDLGATHLPDGRALSCPQLHRAARFWRAKAHAERLAFQRWDFEWNWKRWLPGKFYRVARCETGVDWRFDSGTYVSAFGIIRVAFPSWNGRNTPREQYEVAASIQRRYSWSAWGCGGA